MNQMRDHSNILRPISGFILNFKKELIYDQEKEFLLS